MQIDVRGAPGRSKGVQGAISAAQTPKIEDFRPLKFHTHPTYRRPGPGCGPGVLLKGPGVLLKDSGVLLKDAGVLLKDPGVLLKDPDRRGPFKGLRGPLKGPRGPAHTHPTYTHLGFSPSPKVPHPPRSTVGGRRSTVGGRRSTVAGVL